MNLFSKVNGEIVISEAAYMLKPFKLIYNRDRTKYKEKALQELAFVYFMCDPRSDYKAEVDENVRIAKIKEGEGMEESWKPDKLIKEAMEFYNSFSTSSALLLEDTRMMAYKARKVMNMIDIESIENTEEAVDILDKILKALKNVPNLVKDLDAAERAVASEIIQEDNVRGNIEKSYFE